MLEVVLSVIAQTRVEFNPFDCHVDQCLNFALFSNGNASQCSFNNVGGDLPMQSLGYMRQVTLVNMSGFGSASPIHLEFHCP